MSFDDIKIFLQKSAQDSSASAWTFLLMMYNVGYSKILVEFGRQVTEETATIDLVASQRSYQVPVNCQWPKTLEFYSDTLRYALIQEPSDKIWASMKSGTITGQPTHYHYKPRFGVGGGVLELYPIPSSSDYNLDMVFEAKDKNLSQAAYTTGAVTLTNDDATVTGSGTTFTAAMVGRYLVPTTAGTDAFPYRIASYTSATSVELEQNYGGTTGASLAYKIVEMPNLPEDMHIIPCFYALEAWWSSQGNAAKTKEFKDKYILDMTIAKKTHSVVTRDNVVNEESMVSPFPTYPQYFPQAIS